MKDSDLSKTRPGTNILTKAAHTGHRERNVFITTPIRLHLPRAYLEPCTVKNHNLGSAATAVHLAFGNSQLKYRKSTFT